jgi:hypothetical protein
MLHDFGDEDLSFISEADLHACLACHYRGILKYVKLVFFNPGWPMNNNIRCWEHDIESLYIVESGAWIPVHKFYILDTLILDAWGKLAEYYYRMYDDVNDLERFKGSLATEESFSRIEEFIGDYELLCTGELPMMYSDIRADLFSKIRIYSRNQN